MCIYTYVYICMYIYKYPPENGEIALWPNIHLVKWKCMFYKRQTNSIIRMSGTIF